MQELQTHMPDRDKDTVSQLRRQGIHWGLLLPMTGFNLIYMHCILSSETKLEL